MKCSVDSIDWGSLVLPKYKTILNIQVVFQKAEIYDRCFTWQPHMDVWKNLGHLM